MLHQSRSGPDVDKSTKRNILDFYNEYFYNEFPTIVVSAFIIIFPDFHHVFVLMKNTNVFKSPL